MIFKKKYAVMFLIIQIIIISFFSNYPEFIENFYSLGLYQTISSVNRKILSFIPFSFGDILYLLGFIYCTYYLIIQVINKQFFTIIFIKNLISFLTLLYFIFYFQWGLNYLKVPISKKLDIKFLPRLSFLEDNSFDYAEKIEKLIRKNKENETNKKKYN